MEMRHDRLETSHIILILLVSTASFFEGYDFIILNLILPLLQKEFVLSIREAGLAASAIALGTIAAFFVIRLGDRFGRRSLLIWTVLGYTAATALTALSRSIGAFVALQFAARVFLVAEWGVSTVIVAEEVPAGRRGLAISIVQAAAGLGGIVGSAIFPIVEASPLGWRAMYLVGLVPLIVVFFIRTGLKETRRFLLVRAVSSRAPAFGEILRPPHRRKVVLVALLWCFMYLGYTAVYTFYTTFAIDERGLSIRQVSLIAAVAFTLGLAGFVSAGRLMDSWGRRPTAITFFTAGGISTALAFQAPRALLAPALVVLIFFMTAYLTICGTYTAELFPTRLRASAAAWTNNTLGRIGMVLSPAIVGILAGPLGGVGPAVSLMGLFPILAAVIVLFFLQETKNLELEEISG
ncbi:MAG TPA: MFS transporter, partial [Rectinemataceae bacterium]|nr:MFS transporter [Rectinemataceae bacterium]